MRQGNGTADNTQDVFDDATNELVGLSINYFDGQVITAETRPSGADIARGYAEMRRQQEQARKAPKATPEGEAREAKRTALSRLRVIYAQGGWEAAGWSFEAFRREHDPAWAERRREIEAQSRAGVRATKKANPPALPNVTLKGLPLEIRQEAKARLLSLREFAARKGLPHRFRHLHRDRDGYLRAWLAREAERLEGNSGAERVTLFHHALFGAPITPQSLRRALDMVEHLESPGGPWHVEKWTPG